MRKAKTKEAIVCHTCSEGKERTFCSHRCRVTYDEWVHIAPDETLRQFFEKKYWT